MEKTTKSVAAEARKLQRALANVQKKLGKLEKLVCIEHAHMSEPRWQQHIAKLRSAMFDAYDATNVLYNVVMALEA